MKRFLKYLIFDCDLVVTPLLTLCCILLTVASLHANNCYKVYLSSKGTGPINVIIEAANQTGAIAQIKARYPGAYSISTVQLPCKP